MKIEKEELVLVPIRVTAHCEKCGVEMTRGVCRQEWRQNFDAIYNQDIYSYTCPQCGATEESDERCPRIIYEYRTKEGAIIDEKR